MSIHRCCSIQAANKSWTKNASRSFTLTFDADVIASAAAKFEPGLGNSLSEEWRLIDLPAYQSVSTDTGRKVFLKQLEFSSDASGLLEINAKISEELLTLNK